jgi:hypothetical protein
MERNHGAIGWKRWLGAAVPPTLIVMLFASFAMIVKSQTGWH